MCCRVCLRLQPDPSCCLSIHAAQLESFLPIRNIGCTQLGAALMSEQRDLQRKEKDKSSGEIMEEGVTRLDVNMAAIRVK